MQAPPVAAPPLRPAQRAVSVLVVDDASQFREVACELLERRGYVVAGEADCRASAIAAVRRLAPTAVLLDVNLPDANGVELATELTAVAPDLAVLLVSADPLDGELPPGCGARGFVSKCQLGTVDLARFWPPPAD